MRRCHYAGRTNEQLKIGPLSQWKLEAEFRKKQMSNFVGPLSHLRTWNVRSRMRVDVLG